MKKAPMKKAPPGYHYMPNGKLMKNSLMKKDKKVKKVKVKTAIQDLNYIEILDGLNEGDQVVTGPYNTVSKILKEGNLVQVVAKDKLFEEKKKE